MFAAGNYKALSTTRVQREALVAFVKEKAASSPHVMAIADAAEPPALAELRLYHWGLCVFVVTLLIAIPAFQQRV